MRCQACGERIDDVLEAHARRACPHCDAPLHEKPAEPR
jgi:DNA-directed RNA polymerase subunit RPC12/RpoP